MVNAQQWLDKWYPKNGVCQLKKYKNRWERECDNENYGKTRKKIIKLDISNQDLQGSLKLTDFPNLQEFDCSNNQLTALDLSNCQKIKEIEGGYNQLINLILPVNNQIKSLWCPSNQLTNLPNNLNPLNLTVLGLRDNCFYSNLDIFSQLVNLEKLYIGQNHFTGSLATLANLTKLKEIHVLGTQVNSDLEHLPEHLERFYCGGTKLFEILAPYMNPEYGNPLFGIPGKDGYYNLSEWRKNNQVNKAHRIETNWQENTYPFKNFTNKTTREWTSRNFDKNQSRKWLESGLQSTDANFAQWLRDELKISPAQLLDDYDDEELRKQYDNYLNSKNSDYYSNDWKYFYSDFTPELQQEWEKNGFDYQQTKKWLKSGLQPTDAYYANWLKKCDKTPEWFLEHGIEDVISYSMFSHKGELRRSKEKVNAQEWLNQKYPVKERKNVTELNINGKSLTGSLTIKNWSALETMYNEENHIIDLTLADLPQLKKVYLTWDPLTSLTIRNCPLITDIDLSSGDLASVDWLSSLVSENLTRLNISDNKFPAQDLSIFSHFINLEELYVNSNHFIGSLKPLRNLNKLKTMNISYTKIDSGLEYLSDSLEKLICGDTRLKEILAPYQGDLKKWRKDNQKLISDARSYSEKTQLETQVTSSSKKNKNAKLREAKEQITQLQAELIIERTKNVELEKQVKELQEKLNDLQIHDKAQIQIPPK